MKRKIWCDGMKITGEMYDRMYSPERNKKISLANKDKPKSEEHKKKTSDCVKNLWKDPKYRERVIKTMCENRGGEKNSFYGKKHSKKSRESMSETRKELFKSGKLIHPFLGKTLPKERIEKISGSNHYNWKGGITPLKKKMHNSLRMEKWRQKVFERDDFTCVECDTRGGYLQAHHVVPMSECITLDWQELAFDVDNGDTLCIGCHREYHFGGNN